MTGVALVIPTIGRASLLDALESITRSAGPAPDEIVIVDDRRNAAQPLVIPNREMLCSPVTVVESGGRGPAAARNKGWRASRSPWICFVDDDVVVSNVWLEELQTDLLQADENVGGIQGRIEVPLPTGAPTDWERNVAGLAHSSWITADMAYRRAALERAGGFDERFRRAYREDSDLALRVRREGYSLTVGERTAYHPVRKADAWISVRLQAGNADDVLMRALHGARWRALAGAPAGRFRLHALTAASATACVLSAVAGSRRVAAASGLMWLAATAQYAWSRIAPGPRTFHEIATMSATSVAIPFAAVYHKARGFVQMRRMLRGGNA